MIGYKVMKKEDNIILSGANSNLKFNINSKYIEMPGNGLYVSTNKEYVLDYYSGLSDEEVLLTIEFDEKDIIWGKETLQDKEPEVSVKKGKILNLTYL